MFFLCFDLLGTGKSFWYFNIESLFKTEFIGGYNIRRRPPFLGHTVFYDNIDNVYAQHANTEVSGKICFTYNKDSIFMFVLQNVIIGLRKTAAAFSLVGWWVDSPGGICLGSRTPRIIWVINNICCHTIFNPSTCRVQTTGQKLPLFGEKKLEILIFIAIFGFNMKNTFRWVQISLVLVQRFFRSGMNKVREREAPLPGNDKENWGSHHNDPDNMYMLAQWWANITLSAAQYWSNIICSWAQGWPIFGCGPMVSQ